MYCLLVDDDGDDHGEGNDDHKVISIPNKIIDHVISAAFGSVLPISTLNKCMSYVRVSSFEFFLNDEDDVDCRGSTSPYSLSSVQFLIKLELRYIGF